MYVAARVAMHGTRVTRGSGGAQRLNVKSTVINQYESGKAMPNPQIISRLERALGVKLPRPGKKGKGTKGRKK